MPEVRLHDGSTIDVEVHGEGPTVLLPVNPRPVEGAKAEEMRALGRRPGARPLADRRPQRRVPGRRLRLRGPRPAVPKPDTLTPANVAGDLLAVADAAGADRFAYYGYSWLALAGLQLAIRTDRLSALVMGGYPPVGGPYARDARGSPPRPTTWPSPRGLAAGTATPSHTTAGAGRGAGLVDGGGHALTEAQTRQFVTLYEALQGFDDRAAQARLSCPRLCFVGSADRSLQRAVGRRAASTSPDRSSAGEPSWKRSAGRSRCSTAWTTSRPCRPPVLPVLRPWLVSKLGTSS